MIGDMEVLDLLEDDNNHSLLEPPTPAYTSVTVRRAFIVWFYCGQRNEFRQVCNYFHYLESLEDKLSPQSRAASRTHELNLLSNRPPSSDYLNMHFPKLYRQNKYSKFINKETREPKLEDCIFGFEGYYNLKIHKELSTKEIIKISQMIRKYCKVHSLSLKSFLEQFLDVAKKTQTKDTVSNLSIYIKNKYIEDELETCKYMPKDFGFLNIVEDNISDIDDNDSDVEDLDITDPDEIYEMYNGRRSPTKIRNLINEVSRKEHLMNWLPQLPEIPIGDSEHSKGPNENFISTKIMEGQRELPVDDFESESQI